jgi:hypothetical protein
MRKIYIALTLLMLSAWLFAVDFNWYSQGDARWKQERLGASKRSTIGRSGCVLSCLSMLLNAEATNPRITPDELNAWLSKNGGFRGSDMRWQIPGQFDGKGNGLELVAQINTANNWKFLSDNMAKGNKVIVKVKGRRSHWVLVTKQVGDSDSAASYLINDPATNEYQERTLAYYGGFRAARAYSGNWLDEEAFSMNSDIQIVPVEKDELFLFDIDNLPHPADVFVRLENKLTVTIGGYFILGLFDKDNQFLSTVDYEYATIDSCNTLDLIYKMDDVSKVTEGDCTVRIIYSKYFSNMPSLNDTLPLSKNKHNDKQTNVAVPAQLPEGVN